MDSQPLFHVDDVVALRRWMADYPLATLVVSCDAGLEANLLVLDWPDPSVALLKGHVARRHSLARAACHGVQAVAVFQSPNAYISPRWYVNGQRSGRVAPSWNYLAVQARGTFRLIDDSAWMQEHLHAMTHAQESRRQQPWTLDSAAPGFVQDTARHLIGFEVEVHSVVGKRFLSQQRTQADRENVIRHLLQEPNGAAHDVAGLISP